MTDEEVGQYIRLMCIQANKGHITKKDMFHICKSYDNDVCMKFNNIGGDKFANAILTEIVNQRKNYTESRRNNRKGTKDKNISKSHDNTYVEHMVNVIKDVDVDNNLHRALDEIYLDQQKPKWPHIDFDFEVNTFKEKVRGSPEHYQNHDTSGLRLAFQSQLRNAKKKFNGTDKQTQNLASNIQAFEQRWANKGK